MTNNRPEKAAISWSADLIFAGRRQYARARASLDEIAYKWRVFSFRRARVVGLTLLTAVFVASLLLFTFWLSEDGRSYTYKLAETAAIYLSGGSALLGATAIVSSIVLFSLQINAERTPYGLFRKLSSDVLLLSLFGYAFVVSGAIVIASGFLSQESAPWFNYLGACGVVTTLVALSWSYRRALRLISPIQQINMLLRRVQRTCKVWDRRAERFRPVIEHEVGEPSRAATEFDKIRRAYWDLYPYWSEELEEALKSLSALSQTYASNGDHDVAGKALLAIPPLLSMYLHTRRGTFVPEHPLFPSGSGTDRFINETLETLRKHFESALARGDEQHIDHSISALGKCAQILTQVDYRSEVSTKMHASIATNYLMTAMNSIVRKKMADASMHAIREAGLVAQGMIAASPGMEVLGVIEKLALNAVPAGVANREMYPVSIEAMKKIANASGLLIAAKHNAVVNVAPRLHDVVCVAASYALQQPESRLERSHSTPFEPFFGQGSDSVLPALAVVVSTACSAPADHGPSRQFIENFDRWIEAAGMRYHELYQAAVAVNSSLALDLVMWMRAISDYASALATAPACPEPVKERLEEHARSFLGSLTFRDYSDSELANTGMSQLSAMVAELGVIAARRGQKDLSAQLLDILMDWTGFHVKRGSRFPDSLADNLPRLAAVLVMLNDDFASAKFDKQLATLLQSIVTDTTRLRQLEQRLRGAALRPQDIFLMHLRELHQVDRRKLSDRLIAMADAVGAVLGKAKG